jgi:hypothetical protein
MQSISLTFLSTCRSHFPGTQKTLGLDTPLNLLVVGCELRTQSKEFHSTTLTQAPGPDLLPLVPSAWSVLVIKL